MIGPWFLKVVGLHPGGEVLLDVNQYLLARYNHMMAQTDVDPYTPTPEGMRAIEAACQALALDTGATCWIIANGSDLVAVFDYRDKAWRGTVPVTKSSIH
jgi:hypothetical protein